MSRDGRVATSGRLDDIDENLAGSLGNPLKTITDRIERLMSGQGLADSGSLDEIEAELENTLLQHAIEKAKGNLSAAARLLGITRARLVYRLNQRGLGGSL